ncbi:histidine phosphatase family protein [Burkholderia anthina]|uniref:Histidine phosphatase family protein n=1 Tax=Burkholderia anthina TaxID=179879 RepID=A0A6P2G648_9BURK|nr:histidine phosphatase family protein [Burkholderia anthina]MBM2766756.1 histidine phosphatase family protein [Burkholderia anthina]VVU48591.1 phosphoglycerate mutase family protein [Burkholderia anthina]
MRIVLTRHGQVEGIDPPRFRGRAELELTPLGWRQAALLADTVAARFKPVAVYTSPMKRCRDTGHAIATACAVPEHVQPGIDDFDYGAWQWKSHADALAQFPDQYALWKTAPQWMQFPGGESLQAVALRTADALRELLAAHADEIVVLVAHDSINRVLLLHALDMPLSAYWRVAQDPCCLNVIDIDRAGNAKILQINDTAHLARED